MFATGLIVFRETLEAALFIGIMAAATRGLVGRSKWIVFGVLAGIAGAFGIAELTSVIADSANGMGQEWLNVAVLALAFIMLTWHVIWSSSHGRELAANAKSLGSNVKSGKNSMWAIAIAIAMIVLREGAETVLFVTGAMAGNDAPPPTPVEASAPLNAVQTTPVLVAEIDLTQKPTALQANIKSVPNALPTDLPTELDLTKPVQAKATIQTKDLPKTLDLTQAKSSAAPMIEVAATTSPTETESNTPKTELMSKRDITLGGLAGLGLGALVGLVMYFGLARIPVGQLFSITNVFVVMLAAGMAGQMGNKLVQAQALPSGADPLWNSANLITQESATGTFLHALIGYEAEPSLTQVLFFVGGLLLILTAGRWAKSSLKA